MVVVGICGMMGYDNVGIRLNDCRFYKLNELEMRHSIKLNVREIALNIILDSEYIHTVAYVTLKSIGVKATIVVNADVDDEVVYDIVSTIFENKDAITAAYAKGAALDLEFASVCGVPYHTGAAKYFAEKGIDVLVVD